MSIIHLLSKILLRTENKDTKMVKRIPWGLSVSNAVEEAKENKSRSGVKMETRYMVHVAYSKGSHLGEIRGDPAWTEF